MENLIVRILSIVQGAVASATTPRNESIREAESWTDLNRQTLSTLYRQQWKYHGQRIRPGEGEIRFFKAYFYTLFFIVAW